MRVSKGLAYGYRRITIYANGSGYLDARAEGVTQPQVLPGFKPIWSFRVNVRRLYTRADLQHLVRYAYRYVAD